MEEEDGSRQEGNEARVNNDFGPFQRRRPEGRFRKWRAGATRKEGARKKKEEEEEEEEAVVLREGFIVGNFHSCQRIFLTCVVGVTRGKTYGKTYMNR